MTYHPILASLLATPMLLGVAIGADATSTPEGYVRTGETENCLRLSRIDTMKILNETQILVTTNAGDAWLQEPRSCSKLRKTYAFLYEASTGDLCDTTFIKLIDPGIAGGFAGSCSFDRFQKLEKKTAAAQ